MAILDPLVTTAAGALFATVGVVIGGVIARKAQDRQWLRDKQLAAYDELLGRRRIRPGCRRIRQLAPRNGWHRLRSAAVISSSAAPAAGRPRPV
jgi:hypothetical protein